MRKELTDMLSEAAQDSEHFHRWKNEVRSKFSNNLGPRMMELLRKEARVGNPSDPALLILMVMAEAMGDMLAQAAQKTLPLATDTMFIGLVEQLQICGLDYLERAKKTKAEGK